jgi:hypothetical protein
MRPNNFLRKFEMMQRHNLYFRNGSESSLIMASRSGSALPVLWVRIRKDPNSFAGPGSLTRGCGFGPDPDPKLEFNIIKNHQKINI